MMTDIAVFRSASKWIWICWIRIWISLLDPDLDLHENGHLLHAIAACLFRYEFVTVD